MKRRGRHGQRYTGLCLAGAVWLGGLATAAADQVISDDLIVDGSACIGTNCANGESFGSDTIRLKENNLRITFDDTSTTPNYPNNDWQLTANDNFSGGANKFSIDDITHEQTPFTIEAGAESHALYIADSGKLGLGTAQPLQHIHIVDGNTPTLRLDQDNSEGWDEQVWEVLGNEVAFVIRDVSHASLPLRIKPDAPSESLHIASSGNIGVGTGSPSVSLHVRRSDGSGQVLVEETRAGNGRRLLTLTNNGTLGMDFTDTSPNGETWTALNMGSTFVIIDGDGAETELSLDTSGNLTIKGSLTAAGSVFPDYVFAPGYQLMPLPQLETFISEHQHLPNVPSASEVEKTGLNMTAMQITLMEKVEELTLYTLAQERTMQSQRQMIEALQTRLVQLERGVGSKVAQ